MMMMTDLVA